MKDILFNLGVSSRLLRLLDRMSRLLVCRQVCEWDSEMWQRNI